MPEVTLKVTPEVLNLILQSLQDSVQHRQQQVAILMSSLQAQASSQIQPVLTQPASPQG